MLVVAAFAALAWLTAQPSWSIREAVLGLGIVLIEVILVLGSRDTLRKYKYYSRTGELLGSRTVRQS